MGTAVILRTCGCNWNGWTELHRKQRVFDEKSNGHPFGSRNWLLKLWNVPCSLSSFWLKKLLIKTMECSMLFKTIFEIIKSSSHSLCPQTHHYYLGTILTIPNYFSTIIPSCFACEHWFFLFDPGVFMLNWLSSLKCKTSLTRYCWRKIQNL